IFFFQAEDGIRDFHVTGVQTCALPISRGIRCCTRTAACLDETPHGLKPPFLPLSPRQRNAPYAETIRCGWTSSPRNSSWRWRKRSEERRVGKECRSGWGQEQYEQKYSR